MYGYDNETTLIGSTCTLLHPYKGYSEGEVIDDYGCLLYTSPSPRDCS